MLGDSHKYIILVSRICFPLIHDLLNIPCLIVIFVFCQCLWSFYCNSQIFYIWQPYLFFYINDNLWIPYLVHACLFPYLCQYHFKFYTHVYLYTILMPIKSSVTITNIFIWQPYCFTPLITYSVPCFKDMLSGIIHLIPFIKCTIT